jgi:hypothetical protein
MKIEEGDSFLEMEFKAREFESSLDIEQMNAPTDKAKWVRYVWYEAISVCSNEMK